VAANSLSESSQSVLALLGENLVCGEERRDRESGDFLRGLEERDEVVEIVMAAIQRVKRS